MGILDRVTKVLSFYNSMPVRKLDTQLARSAVKEIARKVVVSERPAIPLEVTANKYIGKLNDAVKAGSKREASAFRPTAFCIGNLAAVAAEDAQDGEQRGRLINLEGRFKDSPRVHSAAAQYGDVTISDIEKPAMDKLNQDYMVLLRYTFFGMRSSKDVQDASNRYFAQKPRTLESFNAPRQTTAELFVMRRLLEARNEYVKVKHLASINFAEYVNKKGFLEVLGIDHSDPKRNDYLTALSRIMKSASAVDLNMEGTTPGPDDKKKLKAYESIMKNIGQMAGNISGTIQDTIEDMMRKTKESVDANVIRRIDGDRSQEISVRYIKANPFKNWLVEVPGDRQLVLTPYDVGQSHPHQVLEGKLETKAYVEFKRAGNIISESVAVELSKAEILKAYDDARIATKGMEAGGMRVDFAATFNRYLKNYLNNKLAESTEGQKQAKAFRHYCEAFRSNKKETQLMHLDAACSLDPLMMEYRRLYRRIDEGTSAIYHKKKAA